MNYKKVSYGLLMLLSIAVVVIPSHGTSEKRNLGGENQLHKKTDWRFQPSFTFDTLCFLNVLTGDSFYVEYYKDDYARFEPQITPGARIALGNLKRKIKDEKKNIISGFLTLYFSAIDDKTLDDMLRTLNNSKRMKRNLQKTTYYSDRDWQLFESVRGDLQVVFTFLKSIRFDDYWKRNILPKIERKIAEIEKDLPKYNVVTEVEKLLGSLLATDKLTVYLLNFSQPHGIKITGLRFITDAAYPFRIVLRNAVHEPMHPPFDLKTDRELRRELDALRGDEFLMDKILNHNPAFGYNSFEGFIEEDSVQALEQIINEKFGVAIEARRRWRENDGGMHVFAVALYKTMKDENFTGLNESFRDFLMRMIRSGRLSAGKTKLIYEAFYSI